MFFNKKEIEQTPEQKRQYSTMCYIRTKVLKTALENGHTIETLQEYQSLLYWMNKGKLRVFYCDGCKVFFDCNNILQVELNGIAI